MFNEDQAPEASGRSKFLIVLVILSSINLGISTMGSIPGMLGQKVDAKTIKDARLDFATMREQLLDAHADSFVGVVDQMEKVTLSMFRHFQVYNSLNFLVMVLGLTGVILMYRQRKLGFHFYIVYSLGTVCIPYLLNPIQDIPTILTIVGLLYSGLWVFLYSRSLHSMH
ncbi:MAG: hypothetical protein RLZZ301_1648 [Bacteroidota bacterium]|jgi:hypothetical protein